MTRARSAATAAVTLVVLSAALTLAVLLTIAPRAAAATGGGAGATVDRTVTDPAITEDSGIAASLLHPGVLWTHNDSGNPPVLYAVGTNGSTVARLTLSGVPNLDWEAIGTWRDATGRALLAVADIGDNAHARTSVEIDILAEPATLARRTLAPLRRLRLTYPDGATDAEAFFVDPRTQRMYVITKGFSSRVYAVPTSAWPAALPAQDAGRAVVQARLEPVGDLPLLLVTDATPLADGHVLVRTYTSLSVVAPMDGGPPRLLATVGLPSQRQGEGLAVDPVKGDVLLSSEGTSQPVLRLPFPADLREALRGTTASGATASGATGSTAATVDPAAGATSRGAATSVVGATPVSATEASTSGVAAASPVWSVLVAAAGAVGVFAVIAAALRRRRRPRSATTGGR